MDFSWPSNVTSTYGNGPASSSFLVFNAFLLCVNVVFGTSGNVLVCCVILRNRGLRTANNALLVNLAAVAFLKCCVDSPVFLVSLIAGKKRVEIGLFLCCVQQFTYSLLSCAQFLTLVLISMERFQAIAFPFKNRNERIRIWILFIWVCGLFFAVLSLTLCDDSVFYMMCQHLLKLPPGSYTDPFGVYVLFPVWGFSLIQIIVYYFRIFSVVRQHTNKITDTGSQFIAPLGIHLLRSDRVAHSAPRTAAPRPQKPGSTQESAFFLPLDKPRSAGNNHAYPRIAGAVCILTPAARELGRKRLEGRVAKRSGYIIITVILFWAPLFVTLFLNMKDFSQNQRWLLREFETCALVLTCVSAAVEPLIYALLHRQLRTQLYKLLPTRLRKKS